MKDMNPLIAEEIEIIDLGKSQLIAVSVYFEGAEDQDYYMISRDVFQRYCEMNGKLEIEDTSLCDETGYESSKTYDIAFSDFLNDITFIDYLRAALIDFIKPRLANKELEGQLKEAQLTIKNLNDENFQLKAELLTTGKRFMYANK